MINNWTGYKAKWFHCWTQTWRSWESACSNETLPICGRKVCISTWIVFEARQRKDRKKKNHHSLYDRDIDFNWTNWCVGSIRQDYPWGWVWTMSNILKQRCVEDLLCSRLCKCVCCAKKCAKELTVGKPILAIVWFLSSVSYWFTAWTKILNQVS